MIFDWDVLQKRLEQAKIEQPRYIVHPDTYKLLIKLFKENFEEIGDILK